MTGRANLLALALTYKLGTQAPVLPLALALAALASRATALGSSCAGTALGAGTAGPDDPFWLQTIKHQGTSAYNSNSSYAVFRNVKDPAYGAKGDGVHDDTAAINAAIADGNRRQSGSSSTTPALVFFPQGTYKVSSAINALYYTQLVGDARNPPTLKAAANFHGVAVIDANPSNLYTPKENFFRSVRNFNIDLTATPGITIQTGIHWPVSKGSSLTNIAIQLGTGLINLHQGILIDDGSGGVISDLVINGGLYGLKAGNQQFTTRNVTVNHAQTGVLLSWAYGWTFQDVSFNNVNVGFDIIGDTIIPLLKGVGSVAIIDSSAANTPTFLRTSGYISSHSESGGSIVLDNIQLTVVPGAVVEAGLLPKTILKGGTTTISHWEQGSSYVGTSPNQTFVRGTVPGPTKPAKLLNSAGKIVGRSRPQYADYAASQFVSVKDLGAKGDGVTDDTAALQAAINQYTGCKIIFVDAGTYLVTKTLGIPIGTQIVGEAWSVIAGTGAAFQNATAPAVVAQVGVGIFQIGTLEVSDLIFTTQGNAPGAIIVEWNAKDGATQAAVGAWDTHIRIGSTAGSGITSQNCGTREIPSKTTCDAAFLGLHLTLGSSAYLEGLWVWLGDYDLDSHEPVYALSARGIFSESQGPVWLIGTAAENHAVYQYNLYAVNNHYLGFVQGQTPIYETASGNGTRKRTEALRFSRDTLSSRNLPGVHLNTLTYHDPFFDPSRAVFAWGVYITQSTGILVFGGGFYSPSTQTNIFFVDTGLTYPAPTKPTTQTYIYALSTVGATNTLTTIYNVTDAANQAGFSGEATIASWTSS